MPIYEYRCPKCGTDFELMRRMAEIDKPAPCPKCGAEAERLVSAAGSKVGFYIRPPAKPAFRKPFEESDKKPEKKRKSS